ncbi:MAG: four-helix bundle copper-binding protein [Gallionellaceae bacterium]|nr:MAG: four-helix bundle copper-binding protein [Gallionellaceae bacterium]
MNRRELLLGAAAMAAVAASGRVFAAEHDAHEHHREMSTRNNSLIEAASDCVLKAQICLQHCLVLLGQGDKSMAACAKSASQVEAVCGALQKLATAEAKNLPQMAKLAMDVCKDCEEECKKTDKHPECKACGEACAACYKECKKIAA